MKIRVKEGQSLVDIALMTTGATEGVWALALRNGLSVTEALAFGAEIAYEGEDIEDAKTAIRYEAEGICPASEVSEKCLAGLLRLPEAPQGWAYEDIEADVVEEQTTGVPLFTDEFTAAFA